MPRTLPFFDQIHLHVKDRISAEDALRQEVTAREILGRLQNQAGVILADEVGMGKTFVALAVAVSVAVSDPENRPVVIMVPPSLKLKWPRDFNFFKDRCLPSELHIKIHEGRAERAEDFLKYLDDPPERRKSILFVTHGAMSRGLTDKWVKLALIRQSLRYKRDIDKLKTCLSRVMGGLLRCSSMDNRKGLGPAFWMKLLDTDPEAWLKIIRQHQEFMLVNEESTATDDPVPLAIREILQSIDTTALFESLDEIPRKKSAYFDENLHSARQAIQDAIRPVWRECLQKTRLRLPLLILDEAHHLKNEETRLASLFQCREAREDMDEIDRGALAGIFERMLFLTATPFQLGHDELCTVLESFKGISWEGETAPAGGKAGIEEDLSALRRSLDGAQEAALRFDMAWGRMRSDHLRVGERVFDDTETWWREARACSDLSPDVDWVVRSHASAFQRLHQAETLLKPWVIRHLRDRHLPPPYNHVTRRSRLPGRSILEDQPDSTRRGIEIAGESLIPFLLAVRATTFMPNRRMLFAEGLASSYEAFLNTRENAVLRNNPAVLDGDDDTNLSSTVSDSLKWYLDRMNDFISTGRDSDPRSHPKINATVKRCVDIWRSGEKAVVFCHFIATGKTLRKAVSAAISAEINRLGAEKLGCAESEVAAILDNLGQRFYDEDSPVRKACDREINALLESFPSLKRWHGELNSVSRRIIRTPSFLVRFFPLTDGRLDENEVQEAFRKPDLSGSTLSRILTDFFEFLDKRCDRSSRLEIIEAIHRIQTGSHYSGSPEIQYSDDELQGDERAMLIPNVRLVNGTTRQETRQRLMLAFNTPFYPEILVASSVLAEGVDLHLNCRFVIHHDLCWNPSTLEQRTGRVDRVGAKTERVGKPIHVYLPYLSQTQDEKMYRVVMDRERWFNVVMGEEYSPDSMNTERLASRIELPESIARELSFKLEVFRAEKRNGAAADET